MMDHNSTVMIELDRPRELRLSNKALREFSALTHTTMDAMEDALKNPDKLQAAVWCMLKQDCIRCGEAVLTPMQVEDLLEDVSPARLSWLVSKAMQAAFYDADIEREINEMKGASPTQAAGTGAKPNVSPLKSE